MVALMSSDSDKHTVAAVQRRDLGRMLSVATRTVCNAEFIEFGGRGCRVCMYLTLPRVATALSSLPFLPHYAGVCGREVGDEGVVRDGVV
jgi:hypothetical protein